MRKRFFYLLVGFILGIVVLTIFNYLSVINNETKYIELKENFLISNGSLLKKGTMLKVDKSAFEGYTRYVIYVNYKSDVGIESKSYSKDNLIKPYWMYRIDSLISH